MRADAIMSEVGGSLGPNLKFKIFSLAMIVAVLSASKGMAQNNNQKFSCYIKAYGIDQQTSKADPDSLLDEEIILSSFRPEFMRSTKYHAIHLNRGESELSIQFVDHISQKNINKIVSLGKGIYHQSQNSSSYFLINCRYLQREPQSNKKVQSKKSILRKK